MQKNCREIKHRAKLFYDFEFGSAFLDMTWKAQATRGKIDTLDFTKIKNLCFKGHHQQSEMTTHRMGENIC